MIENLYSLIDWTFANPVKAFILLFVEYGLIAACYHQRKLRWLARLAAPIFVIQDYLVNWTLSPVFLDFPKPWYRELVTGRMKRYKGLYSISTYNPLELWRYWVAVNLCKLLNRFDPGHC